MIIDVASNCTIIIIVIIAVTATAAIVTTHVVTVILFLRLYLNDWKLNDPWRFFHFS